MLYSGILYIPRAAKDKEADIECFSQEEAAKAIESLKSRTALGGHEMYLEATQALHTVELELMRSIFDRWV